jgi:2-phosphosulfolactate phosphatase
MKINVLLTPIVVDDLYFKDKTTVVIDVLRASSTIVAALSNGAKEIIPVAGIESAIKLSGGMFGGHTLLCGERNTKKIDGFALGNSPLEFTPEIVKNKTIVLYTTNGTKALVKSKFSENLFIGSFLNLNFLTNHLIKLNNDIEIVCAGRNNNFSIEDALCAGFICDKLSQKLKDIVLTDSSKAALSLKRKYQQNIFETLKESDHGKVLIENGFEKDIDYCSQQSVFDIIPHYHNGSVKILNNL